MGPRTQPPVDLDDARAGSVASSYPASPRVAGGPSSRACRRRPPGGWCGIRHSACHGATIRSSRTDAGAAGLAQTAVALSPARRRRRRPRPGARRRGLAQVRARGHLRHPGGAGGRVTLRRVDPDRRAGRQRRLRERCRVRLHHLRRRLRHHQQPRGRRRRRHHREVRRRTEETPPSSAPRPPTTSPS